MLVLAFSTVTAEDDSVTLCPAVCVGTWQAVDHVCVYEECASGCTTPQTEEECNAGLVVEPEEVQENLEVETTTETPEADTTVETTEVETTTETELVGETGDEEVVTTIEAPHPELADSDEPSIQVKRTNPGIAGEKEAEIIFDIVNVDMAHKLEAFLICQSPDDTVVSSTISAGSGSGAQYVSPKFTINEAPTQKSMSITLESDTPGNKHATCSVKYTLFKEEDGKKLYVAKDGTYTEKSGNALKGEKSFEKDVGFDPIGTVQQEGKSKKKGIPGFTLLGVLSALVVAYLIKR